MKKWFLLISFFTAVVVHATPLPSAEVFKVDAALVDPNTFVLSFEIKPNYFLYKNRIKLISKKDSAVQIGPIRFPQTLKYTGKQGKVYSVYRNKVTIPISLLGNTKGKTSVRLSYQGCSDSGFCYPPEIKTIYLTINDTLALTNVSLTTMAASAEKPASQNNKFANLLKGHNWVLILFTFYSFGLLLSFTPCILPMVPVLSGIIVGHGKEITTKKAFFLSLSYVLSMSITYALLGAIVASVGANLQITLQSPWSIGLFSLIFTLLALSMFGFYEFKLPHSWQRKIHGTQQSHREGHYLGAAIMGCLSTLILSPCVTAPLIGVLTYIAQTGNILLGSLTLFVLSLGMGTPLLLIGTSAGKWLPNSGSWMNTLKILFGVLFIAIAIELISRIASPFISMSLWAIFLIFSGIYSGALTYSLSNREKFNQAIGLILLIYGCLVLVGASMGTTNPLQPLVRIAPINDFPLEKKHKERTLTEVKQLIAAARGKPILLDFYADWCTSCKIMEATTFTDPKVQEVLSHFKVIKIDVTANNANDKTLLRYFNVVAPPTFIFFNAQGKELSNLKLVGEISADEFLNTLKEAMAQSSVDNNSY